MTLDCNINWIHMIYFVLNHYFELKIGQIDES
jgi:hypothetical protein